MLDHVFRELLLNVFIVLLPLLLYQYAYRWTSSGWRHGAAVFLLYVLPLLFTMTYPVYIFGSAIDFRSVPFVTGSLYGGPIATICLLAALLVYRDVLGGITMLHYVIALAPAVALLFAAHRRFERFGFWERVWTAVGICFVLRIGSVFIYFGLQGDFANAYNNMLSPQFPLIVAQCALIGLNVYLIEAIRKHQRMKRDILDAEKMKLVSELAASVAHEVRNPLTAVRGFIQLLGDSALGDEKRASYSAICLEELDRAQLIISNYLALSKPEAEEKERLSVKEECHYIANILNSYANYQNVTIVNRVDGDGAVYGNRSKFRQAMINLGKNAIESTPSGGAVEFWSLEKDQGVELYVIDTGSGMTPEQIARLGTPYYSTKEKGTGLGTLVTFNIVRQMGGTIEVRSRIGEGTTCKVTLPYFEEGNNRKKS
ncbi:HAMP domain-containing sensor histidine kinase [Paenibacillus sp.]|uniref:HAMP domain-containing sensor histidine kinase n=1 Tax=Paenibacillus sp. TaxID=58172 RepID=UPI0028126EDA|nr:HAMP domain-containing sensor histidine kinase [Paenibacillus sp.]